MSAHNLVPPWRHYGIDDLTWHDVGEGYARAEVVIGKNETAENPASTKRGIHGPAWVLYSKAPDGGIDTVVKELPAE